MEEVVNKKVSGRAKAAQIIAIIVFALVFSALATAIISDVIVFAQQILGFIAACIMAVVVFIFACVLMLFSIVLIFGIYLLGEYGFWPIAWSLQVFKEILADNKVTSDQIMIFGSIRIVLIILCVVGVILAIVALSINKSVKKEERASITKPFGTLGLIFSILGLLAAVGMLAIVSSLG